MYLKSAFGSSNAFVSKFAIDTFELNWGFQMGSNFNESEGSIYETESIGGRTLGSVSSICNAVSMDDTDIYCLGTLYDSTHFRGFTAVKIKK